LDDQADYLAAKASLEIALRFYDDASFTFAKLADMPGIGEGWPSTNARLTGIRVCRIEHFDQYLIFYRPLDDGIEIIRIIHAARDIDAVLESGPLE
jgi:toxin ParE1/3/4